MPEGDTVWRAARRLDAALRGERLTVGRLQVPRHALVDLSGQTVLGTDSYGKHLFTRCSDGVTLHTHLGMDGSWRVVPPGRTPRADHTVRVLLGTPRTVAVGRLLPVVEVLPTARGSSVRDRLGPDPLSPSWDPARALALLTADPTRAIGETLLDQAVLAGIGNVYATEIAFLLGRTPWAAVGTLLDPARVVVLAHDLLHANRDRSVRSTTGSLRAGRRTWVYGRAGHPCLRCGTLVRRHDPHAGARVAFWCPHCQAGPGPDGRSP